ncbi:hypothetical protein GCM10009122_29910 [Fulvivirga kasyanovii]|uniref:Uncharacterized protein n=1 Tax=Fulvivirga kasyanovii TaxID=396812 RepID=A0ABW9RNU5_9BACT|nr:hypothetical protein [Fulvivirga kasyanovii]MTI24800.1 hypothetical protein [Fulvivirga kasyanovii]
MNIRTTIVFHLLSIFLAAQVLNISMNVSDNLIGKSGPGYKYINEIETVVELVAEMVLSDADVIPETHVPGGTLGFEEEEKHFLEEKEFIHKNSFIPDLLYNSRCLYKSVIFTNHITEVITPPPQS